MLYGLGNCRNFNLNQTLSSRTWKEYFEANEIDAKQQLVELLSSIGAPINTLLSDLLAPATPGEKSLEAISKLYLITLNKIFLFHKLNQTATELIAQYAINSVACYTHCKFTGALGESSHDRFVCGLRHKAIQRCLLAEATLIYTKALEITRGWSQLIKAINYLRRLTPRVYNGRADRINAIRSRPVNSHWHSQSCYRCGIANHNAAYCEFKEAQCHNCAKTGHIAPTCHSKASHTKLPQTE